MRNSPKLPAAALILAVILGAIAAISYIRRSPNPVSLTEVEIGLVAWAFALTIYGIQGLISVLLEGRELRPGIVRPRLTDPLSVAIVVFALVLLGIAIALGTGIVSSWDPRVIGVLAGVGCLDLATLLVFYKEAFVGDEACFDEREDGVPW